MSTVVDVTKAYYDSPDADNFYYHIWGGEDIHIGLYEGNSEPIREASRRTVATMAEGFEKLPPNTRVLDLGAGYGGAARYLVREFGFPVTCLNLSLAQNARNREMNKAAGLAAKIDVVDGDFEALPFADASFDVIWSQDAILHSGRREQVFREMDRVLALGGRVVLTDPMQTTGADPVALRPVLERIHLESMGSIEDYHRYAKKLGWLEAETNRHNQQLVNHYTRVLGELRANLKTLAPLCSEDYLERMQHGLDHWIKAGDAGLLEWGILRFAK